MQIFSCFSNMQSAKIAGWLANIYSGFVAFHLVGFLISAFVLSKYCTNIVKIVKATIKIEMIFITVLRNFDVIPITNSRNIDFLILFNALCCYPNVKVEFRDSGQICTTAPIFLKSNYFRQNIWKSPAAQFHFSFIFGYELNTINCSYEIYKENQFLQARCE